MVYLCRTRRDPLYRQFVYRRYQFLFVINDMGYSHEKYSFVFVFEKAYILTIPHYKEYITFPSFSVMVYYH